MTIHTERERGRMFFLSLSPSPTLTFIERLIMDIFIFGITGKQIRGFFIRTFRSERVLFS